jgi:hypothetical protein
MPLALQLNGDFKEVDLGFIADPMNQRYIDFSPLPPSFAQVLVNRGQTNLVTFFQKRPMQPHSRQPLFRGRSRFPFSDEVFQPCLHPRPDRPLPPAISTTQRGRLLQILTYRVAA